MLIILCLCPFSILAASKDVVTYSKCIDGDTIEVMKGDSKVKVRFLAVDTPETKHPTKGEEPYGKEASAFTCQKIQKAKKIELEYDSNSDKKDKYDRTLAWIWIDDVLLQEELVEQGYAKVAYLYGDYKYTSQLQKLEQEAQKKQRGIWGDYEEDYTSYYVLALVLIIVIIGCICSVSFQKKVKRKIKSTTKKELRKLYKK